jgi:hypothetical protein
MGKSYWTSGLVLLVVASVCVDTQNNPNPASRVWPRDPGNRHNMDKRRFCLHFYKSDWNFDPWFSAPLIYFLKSADRRYYQLSKAMAYVLKIPGYSIRLPITSIARICAINLQFIKRFTLKKS